MWYECLPPAMIMVGAMCVPGLSLHYLNKFFLGTAYRRTIGEDWDVLTYQRDYSLTGNAHKMNGLEKIPDKKE